MLLLSDFSYLLLDLPLLLFEFSYFLLVLELGFFEYFFKTFFLPVLNFAFDHGPLAPGLLLGKLHFARIPFEPVDIALDELLVFELILDELESLGIPFAIVVFIEHLHGLHELVLALALCPVLHALGDLLPLDAGGVDFAQIVRRDDFHQLHHAVQNHVLGVIFALGSEFLSIVGI